MENNYDKGIMGYLVEQCRQPKGFIGRQLLAIWDRVFPKMARWGLSGLELKPTAIVLDIGCGGGASVELLAAMVPAGKVYGIDWAAAAVKRAQKRHRQRISDERVEILQAAAESLPFATASVDQVVAIQTHFYWQDLSGALREIWRVLQPDGQVTLICEKAKLAYHLPAYKEPDRMTAYLRSLGFSAIRLRETDQWLQFIAEKAPSDQ